MNVMVWGRDPSLERAVMDGHHAALSRDEFFTQSDVLSLHLRLNDETRAIIADRRPGRMKPTSLLVNTSRAELIEPDALLGALNHWTPGAMKTAGCIRSRAHPSGSRPAAPGKLCVPPTLATSSRKLTKCTLARLLTTSFISLKAAPPTSSTRRLYRFAASIRLMAWDFWADECY